MAFLREPTIVAQGKKWAVGYFSTETGAVWDEMTTEVQSKFQAKFDMLAQDGYLRDPMMKKIGKFSVWEVELKGKRTGSQRAYCVKANNQRLVTHFGETDHSKRQTRVAAERAERIFAEYREFLDEAK